MTADDFIIGLDIGTAKISAVAGMRSNSGKIRILGYGNSLLPGFSGEAEAEEYIAGEIKQLVEDICKKSGIEKRSVTAGLGGLLFRSNYNKVTLYRDDPEQAISLAEYERVCNCSYGMASCPGEEFVAVIPGEFYLINPKLSADKPGNEAAVDSLHTGLKDRLVGVAPYLFDDSFQSAPNLKKILRTRNPVGKIADAMTCSLLEVIGPTRVTRFISGCITKADLTVEDLIPDPLASANAVLTEREKQDGVLLIDIGGDITNLITYKNGIIIDLLSRPYGGREIWEKLRDLLSFALENIKNSGFPDPRKLRIVLTGGGALVKNLTSFCTIKTKIKTRIGYPDVHLENPVDPDLIDPVYSTAIGLVINGIKRKEKQNEREFRFIQEALKLSRPSSSKLSDEIQKPFTRFINRKMNEDTSDEENAF